MTKTSLYLIILSLAAALSAATERAIIDECAVCRIQRMDHLKKTIVTQSRYKEREYLFCSDSCKAQFDNNPEYYIEPPLPRPAPEFALATLAGNMDSLTNYRGRIMLIDFWASWCAPCVRTMRDLEAVYREFRSDSLIIIGITLDSLGNPQTTNHIERNKITYPILFDSRTSPTWLAYQVKSLPSLYLVNRDGQIVRQWRGASTKSEIDGAVRSVLADSLSVQN